VVLQQAGYEVYIVDDLSNTRISVLDKIQEITDIKPNFSQLDLKDMPEVKQYFKENKFDGVIHFAASKAVGESVLEPLKYYENNINTLVNVLTNMQEQNLSNFIFSSSCTVYGQADELPITENAPIKIAESPYGNTKQIGEEIIRETCQAKELKAIALRYFNPIGAHESAKIGELPLGVPQNLIPFVCQTAAGIRKELSVFGSDYPTPDGTAIRDYIHVVDLAKAHLAALERLLEHKNEANFELFNLGTGTGSSVLEIIQRFESVNNLKLNYKIVERRAGDVISAYADTNKANEVLNWEAKESLDSALKSAWNWQKNQ
jgi:UDP-glucose 4-epimerase